MKPIHSFPNKKAQRIGDALMLLMNHEEVDFEDLEVVLNHILDKWDMSEKKELPVIGEIPAQDLFEFWAENKDLIYPEADDVGE